LIEVIQAEEDDPELKKKNEENLVEIPVEGDLAGEA